MRTLVIAASLLAFSIVTPASAKSQLSQSDKIQLHVGMQKSIKERLVDGKFYYFDDEAHKMVPLYPAKSHHTILSMGDNFVLCSDFRSESGKSVPIDFYMARNGDAFMVIDTVVGNRMPLMRLMKKGEATPID